MADNDTILVVDDALDSLQALATLLASEYPVVMAKNGEQALERLRECQPILILLDILLPDTNGFELLKTIKEMPHMVDVPILMITQLDQPEDEIRSLSLGAADFIPKPINPVIVRARVKLHIRMIKNLRQIQQQALTDGLTGLPNRRQFDQISQIEFQRARRCGRPLSVIMMDIDHFKRLNDSAGHACGDDVLRKIGQCLLGCIQRPGDVVARIGGEEFVVILPDTDLQGAALIAERFRCKVQELAIPHLASNLGSVVTISLGVATYIPEKVDAAFEDILCAADKRLYQAKEKGRNQVAV